MFSHGIPHEYQICVNMVLNYITQNLAEDLSLPVLAKMVDYSPFHFQKIFKQIAGESPKQCVIRIRLETAAHALVIHQHKTVTEIALEHGFSSSATFARSFKNHFGISAEEFRSLPHRKHKENYKQASSFPDKNTKSEEIKTRLQSFNIRVQKKDAFRCVFVNAKLHDDESIQTAFRKVAQLAETHDLVSPTSQFVGAVYLHSGIYRAMIITETKTPKRLNALEIPAGKFVILDLDTGFKENLEQIEVFADFWIPESGYRIADIVGYELLAESPLKKPFHKIKKEIYIPVEPAV